MTLLTEVFIVGSYLLSVLLVAFLCLLSWTSLKEKFRERRKQEIEFVVLQMVHREKLKHDRRAPEA